VRAGSHGRRVKALNRRFLSENAEWLECQAAAARMPAIQVETAHALVFAPAQELCRRWLTDRTATKPVSLAGPLGRAAWAALLAAGTEIARFEALGVIAGPDAQKRGSFLE
jgi:hypothetical protein